MVKWIASCALVTAFVCIERAIDAQAPASASLDEQLIAAAETGPLAKVEALVQAGARANGPDARDILTRPRTPLGMAAWRGDPGIVGILLKAGADPNKPSGLELPLSLAARRCHEEIIRLLLAAGADVYAKQDLGSPFAGATEPNALISALRTAQRVGSCRATALALVEAGAELNERRFGSTPLEAAVEAGEFAVARAMIAKGADVEASIAFAEQRGNRQMVAWLKRTAEPEQTVTDQGVAPDSLLQRLETVVTRAEAPDEIDPATSLPAPANEEEERARAELTAYLKTHPSDAGALVLWARLARVRPELSSLDRTEDEIASALNRAVTLAPTSAVAHYWRGRAYADQQAKTPDGMGARFRSLDRAVESFSKAVALAPANVAYRETLALHLADQGKVIEAKAIVEPVSADDPMLGLLSDLEALPIPPGAQHLVSHVMALPDYELVSSTARGNLMRLRVRKYQISTSFEQIESFYRQKWPGFRLLRDEPKPGEKRGDGQFAHQYLRWIDGVLTPASSVAEVPEVPKEGMMMTLLDVRIGGRRVRHLTILNFRQQ